MLEICWRLQSRGGRILTCALFHDAERSIEVRTFFEANDFIQWAHADDVTAAREVAAQWKSRALTRRFREIA
jgi:hypothetical protein